MHLSDDDMYTFMHAGAGYVLSKRSFSDLVTIAFKNDLTCNEKENSFEDVVIGKCLKSLGVVPSVSLDTKGRILFNPLNPLSGASPDYMNGFINVANFKYKQGIDSMSDFPITFHDVSKDLMYGLEYLLYHAEVMGRRSRLGRMFDKLNDMNKRYKINKKIKQIEKFSRYQFVKY
uniref:Glycoprotein-N-acetylgalactosamine 3-beta-galactosyltransferase 1 n=1 Tax=Parastrongyloides trichosuri TaxID=131310 RepID=A0A0N4Z6X6_PARTI